MTSRPGEHVVLVGGPQDALAARQEGLQVRDTLLLLLPGGRVLTAFLCRRPLGSGMTVAENVLRYGAGGLWIDGCRVACEPGDRTDRLGGNTPKWGTNTYAKDAYSLAARAASPANPSGRWPTNILLVHGPGCRRVGDKRVKASNQPGSVGGLRHTHTYAQDSYSKKYERTERQCYADPDGLETVAAWDCQPDCPVRLLDEQSGDRPTGPGGLTRVNDNSPTYSGPASSQDRQTVGYADAGGASRFYPQFQSLTEALAWLARLIGGPL